MFEHFETNRYDIGQDQFDPEGKFSYQNLAQELTSSTKIISLKEYKAMWGRRMLGGIGAESFIHIVRCEETPAKESTCPTHIELKIHISLREESTCSTRALGWNMVKYILCKNDVGSFKIIRREFNMSSVPEQRGKDITIYAGYSRHLDALDWQRILEEITTTFVEYGVQPGYRQQSTTEKPEKIIKGSKYFSYRYFDEVSQKSIPWPHPDFFGGIDLSHIHQPFEPQEYFSAQKAGFEVK